MHASEESTTMNITKVSTAWVLAHTDRKPNRPRHNWQPLVDALRNVEPGTWLSIPLIELPSDTVTSKQIAVLSVGTRHFGSAQTQTDKTHLFVRVRPASAKADHHQPIQIREEEGLSHG
jgi:hypothetical protein